MTEQEKYTKVWQLHSNYGTFSPGQACAPQFISMLNPTGRVLDLGCGSGKGGLTIKKLNPELDVILVDFVVNSRIDAARALPFIQANLSESIPITGDFGFCCDVLEHIPPELIDQTIINIMDAAPTVFFSITLRLDKAGPASIGEHLHLSVHDEQWWFSTFKRLGMQLVVAISSRVYGEVVVVVKRPLREDAAQI